MTHPLEQTYPNREAWLAARRLGLGGSDASVIMGVSPWQSLMGLWAEKTGLLELTDDTREALEWGHRLEEPIAAAFQDRIGKGVVRLNEPFTIHTHERYPWMKATADAWLYDDPEDDAVVEIKTAGSHMAKQWADDVPLMYLCQVQHTMEVVGAKRGVVVVLIGGQKLKWFNVERNEKFIKVLIEQEESFWRMVEQKIPPPVDGSEATAAALKALYPDDDGEVVPLGSSLLPWADQLAKAKEAKKAAEALELEAKNHLADALGVHAFGLLPDGREISYRQKVVKEHFRKESRFREMRIKD